MVFVITACGGNTTTTVSAGATSNTATAGGSATTEASSAPASLPADAPVLKVGALVSLNAVIGVEIKKWLNLFAKLYNDAGGWKIGDTAYKVQIMIYDAGAGDPATTRAAAEKAVLQDGVKYMICDWGDVPTETITITEPNKVLWMGLDFTDATVDPKLQYSVRAQGLFFAQGLFNYIEQDYMKQGAKSVLVVCPDSQMGKVGAQLVGASAKVTGMQVLDPVFFTANTTDFAPIATKIMNAKPDAVFLSYVGGDQVINIEGALKDVGYKGKILPGNIDPTTLAGCVKRVGAEYMEGQESGYYDPKGIETSPKIVNYIAAYEAEYGTWHPEGCFWIGPWFLFEDAINGTQSTDVDTLIKYLKSSNHGVQTMTGYTQLFARPDISNFSTIDSAPGHYVGVVHNGQFVYHSTIACKDQYLASVIDYGLQNVYMKYWDQYGKPTFPDQPSRYDFSDVTATPVTPAP
jgi:ABC-type branched-subunit amino acid transport system substrate-binding protein